MCRYAKTMCYHDSHMTSCILCAQESAPCVLDPFLTCVVGSGNETTLAMVLCIYLQYSYIGIFEGFNLITGDHYHFSQVQFLLMCTVVYPTCIIQ